MADGSSCRTQIGQRSEQTGAGPLRGAAEHSAGIASSYSLQANSAAYEASAFAQAAGKGAIAPAKASTEAMKTVAENLALTG
ncbi:hypothetical protein [Streptomyces decoyicus]|uniref:hypothetical protein n=1 Tax=Streptomyces decoyicus TaxID=249567 RepID=UPI003866D491|nr:hypothetical protein OG532_38780 [Streptomyces decoyicus]